VLSGWPATVRVGDTTAPILLGEVIVLPGSLRPEVVSVTAPGQRTLTLPACGGGVSRGGSGGPVSKLRDPLSLRCGVTLPNRVALAPLTNIQSNTDGTLHDDELRWLERRAGRFGLLSTCAAFVSEEGHAWDGQLGIASEAHLPGLRRLAGVLREAGSVPIVQLHHGGDKATLAPQKLSTVDADGVKGATASDLKRVVDDFVAAALRAESAGFAGVEVHGANGYLFTQFLAPADNPRTDRYGGGLTGRARLLRETMRAVRASTGPDFIVGVRLSVVDLWSRLGLVVADGAQVARWMADDGADFVHLSLKDASGSPPHEDSDVPVARTIRDALPESVALLAAGGIWTRADAERAEATGADVVVLGRSAIGNPDWPIEAFDEGYAPVRPPWTPEHLRSVSVSDNLLGYLRRFSGLVTDGTPARS
jgi:2,4-dienoyl-CoA reductase-like NADH-dependent reductase (Old Yellow Enzyme family)